LEADWDGKTKRSKNGEGNLFDIQLFFNHIGTFQLKDIPGISIFDGPIFAQ